MIFKTDFGLKVRAVRRNRAMSGCLGIDTAQDRHDDLHVRLGPGRHCRRGARSDQVGFADDGLSATRSTPTWSWCSAGSAIFWASSTGAGIIGVGETILAFKYNTVIGQVARFRVHRDRDPRRFREASSAIYERR